MMTLSTVRYNLESVINSRKFAFGLCITRTFSYDINKVNTKTVSTIVIIYLHLKHMLNIFYTQKWDFYVCGAFFGLETRKIGVFLFHLDVRYIKQG